MVADGWFLEGVDKEGVGDLGTTEEGAVYPQRPTTPGGLHRGTVVMEAGGVALVGLEAGTVVGNLVGTLLVEVLLTAWERRKGEGGVPRD